MQERRSHISDRPFATMLMSTELLPPAESGYVWERTIMCAAAHRLQINPSDGSNPRDYIILISITNASITRPTGPRRLARKKQG